MSSQVLDRRPASASTTGPGSALPATPASVSAPVPAPFAAPVPTAALELLDRSADGLRLAERCDDAGDRFVAAHLAALRAAAAVLAVRGRPKRASGALNVWQVLPRVAPELGEWAAFFAAGAPKRSAIEAGRGHVVTTRQADDLLRDATAFAGIVAESLGVLPPP